MVNGTMLPFSALSGSSNVKRLSEVGRASPAIAFTASSQLGALSWAALRPASSGASAAAALAPSRNARRSTSGVCMGGCIARTGPHYQRQHQTRNAQSDEKLESE